MAIKDEAISDIIDDWDDFDDLEVGDTFPCPECKSTFYEQLFVTKDGYTVVGCSECKRTHGQ